MINKKIPTIMYIVILVMGVLSGIISAVAFGSFAFFELFYFICIALGIVALISSKTKNHIAMSILLVSFGLSVNMLIWAIEIQIGISQVLNVVLSALCFISALFFIHTYYNIKKVKAISIICSAIWAIVIIALAVYNLCVSIIAANGALLNTCYIIQNLSLISTIMIPIYEILCIKSNI